MKAPKKKAAKRASKPPADAAPPEKLYRPFEKLAKEQKLGKKPREQAGAAGAAGAPRAQGAPAGQGAARGQAPSQGGRGGAEAARAKQAGGAGVKPGAHNSHPWHAPNGAAAGEHAMEPGDAETFAVYMAGVRELSDRATRIPRSASRVERAAKGTLPAIDADAPARAELQALVAEGIRFEATDDGERIEGRRIEVEPREVRRLRRGQYTVDQQLDLHGLSVPEARRAIEAFVEKRRKEGDRVVRIIHGKGGHSPRGVSALRGEIAAWLSQGPAKRHIAAFATAPPEEGGAGALLVLLMRPRA